MSIITNALTYIMVNKTSYFVKSWKIISQSDKFFKTCPIPHQRLNFQILPKPGFGQMHYKYAFGGKKVNVQINTLGKIMGVAVAVQTSQYS